MSVMRVMGTETEYGISVPGEPGANPMTTSSLLVNAYVGAEGGARRTRWDFEEEDPLRDARGFSMSRAVADPSQLTDEDLGMANAVLPNGARFYVDHAHPEYSSPETTGPLDAVRWDAAGDLVLAAAAQRAARLPGSPQVTLYKNNTDGKGASYGAHENYLMDRATPFPEIVRHLVPFLVSRQVVCGAGRVGLGQNGQQHGFQVSQRADFFETEVGLETTLKRPIVNTRDEPHATAEKYRRLHVIIGDANLSQTSTLLKLGTTSLVLAMVEDGVLPGGLDLATAVPSLHAISHDPSLTTTVELRDGRQMTALDLQEAYLEAARAYVADRQGDDVDVQTAQVLGLWGSVLDRLRRDPLECSRELDWVAKLSLLQAFRDRDGLDWSSARLAAIDLQYSDLRPDKGLFHRLVERGRMVRLVDETDVTRAVGIPPEDTRAYFRGRCVRKYGAQVSAASWDSVVFDLPGRATLQRVPTMEPLRGTRDHVGDLLDRCETATELVDALTRR